MRVYRLTSAKFESTAFEGIGSKRVGGRWNSPGRAVVYTSEHPAVAAMELLVHVKRSQLLRDSYLMIPVEVPDDLVETLNPVALSPGWNSPEESRLTTDIGDAWYDQGASVALRVPSVVMSGQFNVLLNPLHRGWQRIRRSAAKPFLFDARLGE
ncbi:MAG: RES family NAD+ phosphorylase [Trueperaceae bacterium]